MKVLICRLCIFVACSLCLVQRLPHAFGQPPSPGGGPTVIPGGGSGGSIGVSILQTPSNPVLLGKTIALTGQVTNAQGNESPNYSKKACAENAWETRPEWAAWTIYVCADCEGTATYKLGVTRPGGDTGSATTDIEIVGPDSVVPTSSINAESSSGNPRVVEHRFVPVRGTESLGTCVTLCVSEKVTDSSDPNFPQEPAEWSDDACSSAASPGFYYAGNQIHDTKAYVADPNVWPTIPVGTVIYEYVQWVRVKVPVCCGNAKYVSSAAMPFQVIKISADKIKHVPQF